MICEFCGSTLDDNELECPYCGHKTNIEPQVVTVDYNEYEEPVVNYNEQEFDVEPDEYNYSEDDTFSEPEIEEDDEDYAEESHIAKKKLSFKVPNFNFDRKSSATSKSNSVNKPIGDMPKLAIMAASAILSLICLVSVISVKSKIDSLEQTMLSQFYQLQSANNDLANTISGINGQISSVNSTISEANDSKNITITRNPTSESTYLGRGSDDDVSQNSPIFYAEASGAIQSVEWQVKENGEWVTISWDGNSNNQTYGLHVYNDIGPTSSQSQLCSRNVTSNAFGKSYRCVFKDAYGTKSTEVVTLNERAK